MLRSFLGTGTAIALLSLCAVPSSAQSVIYVDDDARPGGNGTTWLSAFKCLQDALSAATSGDEIHVAEGVYKPDQDEGGNVTPGDREATFQLIGGVAIYGGYAGLMDLAHADQRDFSRFETILSGDLTDNDIEFTSEFARCFAYSFPLPSICRKYDLNGDSEVDLAEGNLGDNSYEVVTATDLQETATLDGLTITAGADDRGWAGDDGAALRVEDAALRITRCCFRHNFSYCAGAVHVSTTPALTFEKCLFEGNGASFEGGALEITGGNVTLSECTFQRNSSFQSGAIRIGSNANADINRCTFSGNNAWQTAGAITNGSPSTKIAKCLFDANRAERGSSGAVLAKDGTITDCVFTRNFAGG